MIRLSAEAEPEIFQTTKTYGTVLENVAVDERGVIDLDDDSKTENTRAAYKLERISNALPHEDGRASERGRDADRGRLRDPAADRAADARPGALLLPLRLHRQARRHRDRRRRSRSRRSRPASAHRSCRSRRPSTRACSARSSTATARPSGSSTPAGRAGRTARGIGCRSRRPAGSSTPRSRASSTASSTAPTTSSASTFPSRVPGVDASLLDPRSTWRDRDAYDAKASELAGMFVANFEKFAADAGEAVTAAGRVRRRAVRPRLSELPRPASGSFLSMEPTYDVLVVGAGCAGMRAAIEAHDRGAKVAVISKLHPTRSHSGAAEGGINAALGNKAEDSPETHAFDTVKGSDYLGDQDAIEIFTAEAPGDIYQLEHWGAVFSRNAEGRLDQRPFGAAGSPRTVYAADITGHVLIQVLYEQLQRRMAEGHRRLRGVLRVPARHRGRPLHGGDLLGPDERRRQAGHRQVGDPRDRRRRPPLPRDHERVRLHRRRHVDGAARGAAAEGHRVHAVPPDHDVPERDPHHRGLPRRGRLPDQQGGRALHAALRPERARARLARRRLALGDDRDRGRAAASTAPSSSTCATSAPRRSSRSCRARASSR